MANNKITNTLFSFLQYSVNKEWATFGQQLLNIRYKGNYDQKKAYIYAFLTIGLSYFKKKTYKIKNDKV